MVAGRTHFSMGLAALLLICAALLPPAANAGVRAHLDRSQIVEGETVTLTIASDDGKQNLNPDLSALEKDFDILDRRSETQISLVNGRQQASVSLSLTLEPRHSGRIGIPALRVGSHSTQPLTIEVEPAPPLAAGTQPAVFIETEVLPRDGPHYVHAQLTLVVRVFYRQSLSEASMEPPEPAPASIRLLQETPYQADRGGEKYRVLERVYAIFPERSGTLEIPAMRLTGRLLERPPGSLWQPTRRGRRVQVESQALRVAVRPRPAAFDGAEWQPARDLRISQQLSRADGLRVGEPVTRTVILDAVGLEDNMLSEPEWPDLPGARIYPDQPQGITRDDGKWVLGHKEFRYAVVPEKPGELILPELEVKWWDVVNDRERIATLPAQKVRVQPSALAPPPPPAATAVVAETASEAVRPFGPWRLAALVFALLWLMTLTVAWRLYRGGGREEPGGNPVMVAEADTLAALRKACGRSDRDTARRLLRAWLRAAGRSGSLLEFAAGLDDEGLERTIRDLDAAACRPGGSADWDGPQFWKLFIAWHARSGATGRNRPAAATDIYAPGNRSP